MDIFHKEADTEPRDDQRLPWRKPDFQVLAVALDTVFGGGSNIDGDLGNLFAQPV